MSYFDHHCYPDCCNEYVFCHKIITDKFIIVMNTRIYMHSNSPVPRSSKRGVCLTHRRLIVDRRIDDLKRRHVVAVVEVAMRALMSCYSHWALMETTAGAKFPARARYVAVIATEIALYALMSCCYYMC